jgi:hypothetical protein
MDPATAVTIFGVGSAAIGLWVVARFPGAGPQTIRSAGIVVIAMLILQSPLLRLVQPVALGYGVSAALLLVVLPSLTLLFWSAACFVKSVVTLMAPYRH